MSERICVAGVGAIGGLIGAMLGQTTENLSLVARGARARALRENGLVLHSDRYGERSARPARVAEQASELGVQDVIFVCVKNYSLDEIAENLRPAVGSHTLIVPVMNGVEAGDRLRARFPEATVCDALIYTITAANADGSATQKGGYTYLFLGGNGNPREEEGARHALGLLRATGFDARWAEDVRSELWQKFVLNCAFNTVTARYLCDNAAIRGSEALRADSLALLREAERAGRAEGVRLPDRLAEKKFAFMMNVQSPDATSSMKRDAEAGRPMETDAFTGTVLRKAEAHGFEAPVSARYHRELTERYGV